MKTAKLGALFLISVIALAGIGVGYAQLEETLTIGGEATVGNIDCKFFHTESNDGSTELDPAECSYWTVVDSTQYEWMGNRYTRHAGTTNTDIITGGKEFTVTIDCAYTCYWANIIYFIKNYGCIPAHVESIKLTHVSGPGYSYDVNQDLETCKYYYIDVEGYTIVKRNNPGTGTSNEDFMLHVSHLSICNEIGGSNDLTGDDWTRGDLCIHMENGVQANSVYDFTIEIVYKQWKA